MRKIFLLVVLTCTILWAAVCQAAQVTDVKWGVDKNNVLRFVVDLTDNATYDVDVDGSTLRLTVSAKPRAAALGSKRIKSDLADSMRVFASGDDTVIEVPLKQAVAASDCKAFVLKTDPVTKRPARVVLDVNTAKRVAAAAPAAAAATAAPKAAAATPSPKAAAAAAKPQAAAPKTPAQRSSRAAQAKAYAAVSVGNKPVVGSTPVRGTAVQQPAAQTAGESKPTVNQPAVTTDTNKNAVVSTEKPKEKEKKKDKAEKKKKDKKKDKKKNKKNDKEDKDTAIKGSGKYSTSGGLKGKIITLDAGHGGSDPGAIGASGVKEKEITLAITKLLKENLEAKGAKVYMTRSRDADVYGPNASDVQELQARVNVGEKYKSDIFVSVHINSSVNKSVGGISTYYYPKTNNDLRLAKAVQKKLTDNFGVDDLGVRQANFYVIKRISMPAVLLELCFISNAKEEKLIRGGWFQKKAAKMIAEGVENYFS